MDVFGLATLRDLPDIEKLRTKAERRRGALGITDDSKLATGRPLVALSLPSISRR